MAEARVDAEWNHTSAILAMLANINRDPKKHGPYRPEDFHPLKRHARSEGIRITKSSIGVLKVLCKYWPGCGQTLR
jgi:hypothetical protein